MNRFSVVFARVVCTDSWAQVELSCETDKHSNKKSNFGLIEQGYLLRCSLALCSKLKQSQLIGHFNRIVKDFHVRVTQNGFVWYITDTVDSMIAVKNVIYQHELENDTDRLIDIYKILMNKLQQQDNSLPKVDVEAKQIEQ